MSCNGCNVDSRIRHELSELKSVQPGCRIRQEVSWQESTPPPGPRGLAEGPPGAALANIRHLQYNVITKPGLDSANVEVSAGAAPAFSRALSNPGI